MKYILTLEKYQSYKDYESGRSKWGTPSDIEEDVRITVINMLKGDISDRLIDVEFEDQSTDKGIKWQITLKGKGADLIHAYKIGNWRGAYEWYLNKKKSTRDDILRYLKDKYMSQLEIFLSAARGYDYYAQYIDDGGQYRNAVARNQSIQDLFNKLSNSDKRAAVKELEKLKGKDQVQNIFKA